MKKEEKKTVFFKDELNDDFADNKISTKKIPSNYRYLNKLFIRCPNLNNRDAIHVPTKD